MADSVMRDFHSLLPPRRAMLLCGLMSATLLAGAFLFEYVGTGAMPYVHLATLGACRHHRLRVSGTGRFIPAPCPGGIGDPCRRRSSKRRHRRLSRRR